MPRQDFASAGATAHTASYYAASANPSPERPPLKGDLTIDILIVGAGYSGLSTGLHLVEKGYKVAIIEAARVGWGASGRNGGQLVNGLNASLQTIRKRYGEDTYICRRKCTSGRICTLRLGGGTDTRPLPFCSPGSACI